MRRRTRFSSLQDFDGWFVRSPTGAISQLDRLPAADFRGRILYMMIFLNLIKNRHTLGTAIWTMDSIIDAHCTIHRTLEELHAIFPPLKSGTPVN